MPPFTATLSHDPDQLRGLRHSLVSWYESDGVPEHCRDALTLATHEAAANAMKHGEADELVTVTVTQAAGDITVVVENQPQWARAPGPGRRGLAMMRDLMTEVRSTTTVRMSCDH